MLLPLVSAGATVLYGASVLSAGGGVSSAGGSVYSTGGGVSSATSVVFAAVVSAAVVANFDTIITYK